MTKKWPRKSSASAPRLLQKHLLKNNRLHLPQNQRGKETEQMKTNNTMKSTIAFLFVFCLVSSSAFANNEIPGAPQTKPIAIVGGKVFTVSHGIIENGTVVFDKGKITAVGANVEIPKDAKVIDAKGKYVYPGMI